MTDETESLLIRTVACFLNLLKGLQSGPTPEEYDRGIRPEKRFHPVQHCEYSGRPELAVERGVECWNCGSDRWVGTKHKPKCVACGEWDLHSNSYLPDDVTVDDIEPLVPSDEFGNRIDPHLTEPLGPERSDQ